jgi:LysR family hydrogen peroxide-inducible transcriptional activator
MNIRDLKYVVAVAGERHFGRAADKCHVSQPALSGQIRKLEDALGVVLFERTNRAVRVTPVGERIVAQARRLITLSDEIVASAQAARDPLAGQFRLGMISTIGPYLSPLILSAIRTELPDLSLTLVEGLTIELERCLANGELDGAILATVPGGSHLMEIVLYDEPFWIALPDGHPLAGHKAIGLAELADDELLLLADGHCLRDQVLDACHTATAAAKANTRETSLETLLALVAAGDGITLVPALAKPRDGRVPDTIVLRPAASGATGRTVRLVCRTSFPRTELVARLASIIRSSLPEGAVDPMQSGL